MKKLFLTLCLSLAALNTFAGARDSLMIGNPLILLYDGPVSNTEPRPGYGRAPICAPSVSIDDHTLYFWDSCAFLIYIKEEDADGNEQVVYTTIVTADETSTILPSELVGNYIIEVIRGEQCFIGEIEL
ncbi:MAG: hypothetical protein IJ699_00080 [Bacteroidaceae bacterium]|nr:hypothetical protein [Bacteroidaceae bacterium]